MSFTSACRTASLLSAAVLLCASKQASAAALHGRYLLENATGIDTWGNAIVEYNQAVQDTVKSIPAGDLHFTYDTYVGPPPARGRSRTGGAALAGGFFMAKGVRVKPGFELSWVQTIAASTTITGDNDWNFDPNANNGKFPDTSPPDKEYPYQDIDWLPAAAAPTQAFQDWPSRPMDSNHQWLAQLGLVCIADDEDALGFREVRVVGTFLWGFHYNLPAPPAVPGIANVLPDSPALWGAPTPNFLATLNGFFDGLGGAGGAGDAGKITNKYKFASNTNCFELLPRCGNAVCDIADGETPCTCPLDCPGGCPFCGDGLCQSGESPCTCSADCRGHCGGCGDGVCSGGENTCSCPSDCPGPCSHDAPAVPPGASYFLGGLLGFFGLYFLGRRRSVGSI